jgi:hypothetical protein
MELIKNKIKVRYARKSNVLDCTRDAGRVEWISEILKDVDMVNGVQKSISLDLLPLQKIGIYFDGYHSE